MSTSPFDELTKEYLAEAEKHFGTLADPLLQAIKEGTLEPKHLLYLLKQCPFLHLRSTESNLPNDMQLEVQLFTLPNTNWTVQDYGGKILLSSAGSFLFADAEYLSKVNPGKGTLDNQAFNTARDLIKLIKASYHWPGIEIVDGSALMIRGAWIEANNQQIPVSFKQAHQEPNDVDHLVKWRLENELYNIKEDEPDPGHDLNKGA